MAADIEEDDLVLGKLENQRDAIRVCDAYRVTTDQGAAEGVPMKLRLKGIVL